MAKSLTPKLKKILTEAGCYFERPGKGDHDIWYSPTPAIKQRQLPKQF
jgi:hypothetical protein